MEYMEGREQNRELKDKGKKWLIKNKGIKPKYYFTESKAEEAPNSSSSQSYQSSVWFSIVHTRMSL